jgi:hypothetical protein
MGFLRRKRLELLPEKAGEREWITGELETKEQ